jgi:glyoxylase-like metal-dependent hydrolase (beta-lactamase superfamily II)
MRGRSPVRIGVASPVRLLDRRPSDHLASPTGADATAAFLAAPDPVVVEYEIAEGVGGILPADLQVIGTPGHTPGHVSFLLERDGGLLFVGDAAVAKNGEVKRGYMNRAEPTFDASLGHVAEYDFERAAFGHAAPLQSGASAAFSRFVESMG